MQDPIDQTLERARRVGTPERHLSKLSFNVESELLLVFLLDTDMPERSIDVESREELGPA